MANTPYVFIIFILLSCVSNVISGPPDTKKNPEETIGPSASEIFETRVAEMVDIRITQMVETRFAEMIETKVAEIVDAKVSEMVETKVAEMVKTRVAEIVEPRVVQDISKLKDEIKRELAFDKTEESKKINEKNNEIVKKGKNFDKILTEDLRQNLKDELMTELNQSIASVVPRAVRDLPYLVTCAYKAFEHYSGRMSYDYLTTDWNNGDHVDGGHGVLDVSTGVFTAGTPGHYTATISGYTVNSDSGNSCSELFMYLNDQRVKETWFTSGFGGQHDQGFFDQGSRTMIFHMNEGDTLHIEVEQANSEDYFARMTFCITLSTWDY